MTKNTSKTQKLSPSTKTSQQDIVKGDKIHESQDGTFYRVDSIKTKVTITEHPNDHLYRGLPGGYTFNKALMEVMGRLPKDKLPDFLSGKWLANEQATKEFIETVQVGDIVGIKNDSFKVLGKDDENIFVTDRSKMQEGFYQPVITMAEIDFARELGLADILRRNDKVYGIPSEEDMTVKFPVPCNKDGTDLPPASTKPVKNSSNSKPKQKLSKTKT